MLLLLFTLAVAINQWQHNSAQEAAYRDGLAAASNKDWDKAVQSFAGAGDHPNAAGREADALKKVYQRDQLYQEGIQAWNKHDWHTAIVKLSNLQTIQPSYLDGAARLEQAQEQTLATGLANIAYLVNSGPAAGLYIRDNSGKTIRLRGTDEHSLVRAISPDGNAFAYDRPSSEVDYLPSSITHHNSVVEDYLGRDPSERVIVLARISNAEITETPIPQLDFNGTGTFAADGLWWYTARPGGSIADYEVYYYSFSSPFGAKAIKLSDLQNNRRVLALDPQHEQAVIAEGDKIAGASGQTRLYRVRMSAPNSPDLLLTTGGDVRRASISGDGDWLLYASQHYSGEIAVSWGLIQLGKSQVGIPGCPAARCGNAIA